MFTFHTDKLLDSETILKKQHQIHVMVGCAAFR